jgi:hypothetical protein
VEIKMGKKGNRELGEKEKSARTRCLRLSKAPLRHTVHCGNLKKEKREIGN